MLKRGKIKKADVDAYLDRLRVAIKHREGISAELGRAIAANETERQLELSLEQAETTRTVMGAAYDWYMLDRQYNRERGT